MRIWVHLWSFLAQCFLECEMLQTKPLNKINTEFLFNFFRRSCRLWDTIVKYSTAGQVTDDIIRRLRIECWITGYKLALRIYNTHCFPLQQLLHDRSSILRYAYITSLVYQKMKPSFIEILKSNYNNQALNYLFNHNLSLPISHIQNLPLILFFIYSCADLLLLSRKVLQNLTTTRHFKFFVICIIRLQLKLKNSIVWFDLLIDLYNKI